ncbi:MAG: hypothetical protein FWB96_08160 [Defluviitaleaceae bacterium]|nr:hypothetical protein [Defluviitaleaceae bacterium]MCL2224924.1 hypothetical protein [Defluviitaleaceae bacterium]MCL2262514.1 hypothetical protein [Defluviitaleaceae bacterium]
MALKNEAGYQLYLDVLDILEKNNYSLKTEKDGISTKISAVFKNNAACGKVFVVSAPPQKRDTSMYAMSAHAKLVLQKDAVRGGNYENLTEGAAADNDGCLWYFGHDETAWVSLVDTKLPEWREKSPLYLETVAATEKLKKKKPETADEFAQLQGEFEALAVKFTSISSYRNAPELAGECRTYVTGLKEKLYQKTTKSLDKLKKTSPSENSGELVKTIAAYENLLDTFTAIRDFDDVIDKISFCNSEIAKLSAYHEAAAYKEAATELSDLEERPETEKFFDQLHRARKYNKISKKFKSIIPYDNSKELSKRCKKQHVHFRRKVLKKSAPFILILFALAVIAVVVLILTM